MIRFNGCDRGYLNLRILDYEFPKFNRLNGDDYYDLNWLTIQVIYSRDDISEYQYEDSCLLTFEWKSIIEEFKKVNNGFKTRYHGDFLEPYFKISLENKGDDYEVSCLFVTKSIEEEEAIYIKSIITESELEECIQEMKKQLEMFPER